MRLSNKLIYIISSIFLILLFLGSDNALLTEVNSFTNNDQTDDKGWPFDSTTLLTDVASFIIIGILTYIATRLNAWLKSNKEIKQELSDGRLNYDKLFKMVEIAVADLKSYKEINSKEVDEIRNDYNGINTRVIQSVERIENIKEDVKELRDELRYK